MSRFLLVIQIYYNLGTKTDSIYEERMNERAGKKLNILDAYYSLTCLLEVCANETLKYKKPETYAFHRDPTAITPLPLPTIPSANISLPPVFSPLTPLWLTAYPAFPPRLPFISSPLLPHTSIRTVHRTSDSPVKAQVSF